MGNCLRNLFGRMRRRRNVDRHIVLLLVGLDNAGKSLILNRIIGADPDRNVLPTMGFRTISIRYRSFEVRIYDLGGSPQIRSIWSKYYHDVHGVIYVVDASDISRLTENRIVLEELISHERISGKPLLLLANKQDVRGAVDELDLVENLDVERVANSMRCPTRVETCSCFYPVSKSKSTRGIVNGYEWLLDTVIKNHFALDQRVKAERKYTNGVLRRSPIFVDATSEPPERTDGDPFRPIHELLSEREGSSSTDCLSSDFFEKKKKRKEILKHVFVSRRNKTAPLALDLRSNDSHRVEADIPKFCQRNGDCSTVVTLDVSMLESRRGSKERRKSSRPNTAPQRSLRGGTILSEMPGQVPR